MSDIHRWTCGLHIGSAIPEGLSYPTEMQRFVCSRCGSIVSLPNCGRMTCLILLSLGCEGEKERAPLPRKEVTYADDDKDLHGLPNPNKGKTNKQHHGVRGQRH